MVDSGPQSSHNTSTSISQLLIKVTQGDVESIEEFEQLDGDDARGARIFVRQSARWRTFGAKSE